MEAASSAAEASRQAERGEACLEGQAEALANPPRVAAERQVEPAVEQSAGLLQLSRT